MPTVTPEDVARAENALKSRYGVDQADPAYVAWLSDLLSTEREGSESRGGQAYSVRGELVAELSKRFPSALLVDPAEPGWLVVVVAISTGRAAWHVPSSQQATLFSHLSLSRVEWDGVDGASARLPVEKWRRMSVLPPATPRVGP